MAGGAGAVAGVARESCARCCQLYELTALTTLKGRIPLILPCEHNACHSCIISIIKRSEPLICPVCSSRVEYPAVEPKQAEEVVWSTYPVHTFLFGKLALELIKEPPLQSNDQQVEHPDPYIDINAIITSAGPDAQKCIECNNGTSLKCKQCDYILCDTCFDRIHCFHPCMKKHTKENIGVECSVVECTVHPRKALDYYCENCKKTICMDCMLLGDKTCFSHKIVSLKEKNVGNLDKLKAVTVEVDEIFRRLTKTALDIGKMLQTMDTFEESQSEAAVLGMSARQHYLQLHSLLQVQEEDILKQVEALKTSELKAVQETKQAVADGLRATRTLLNKLKSAADSDNVDKVNISALINEANEFRNTPWFLQKAEIHEYETLKLTVNTEVQDMLREHLRLDGKPKFVYELLATKDISGYVEIPPAPPRPLFPPEFVRDVREVEKKPIIPEEKPTKKKEKKTDFSMNYYPKFQPARSASVSSINSSNSEQSQKPTYPQHKPHKYGPVSPLMKNQANIQTVTPYDTAPKTLEEGSRELVYITHINSPSDFYVQRSCLQTRLKQIMAELRKADGYDKPKAAQITEGSLLLGMCQLDNNKWHRCRVVTIDHTDPKVTLYHVFYIDFGQTETIPYERLRLLPTSQMRCEAAHALHCTLANCKPAKGAWSHDDNMLMHQIINNKQSLMYVRRTLGATNFGLALECDLTTWEDHVNVVQALVFHERAHFVDPQLQYPKLPQLEEKPRMFFSNDLKKGSVEEVLITHIVNPDKFYVRKCHLQSKYDKLCEEMDDVYKMRIKAGSVYCPEVGMVVAVNLDKYTEQVCVGGWRRGMVMALPGQSKVQVSLPDSGHVALVHWSALRRIHPRFTTMKALAIECYLSQITPVSSKWSKGSVYLLEGHAHRTLQMYMTEEHRNKLALGVVLYDHSDPENVVCINDEFVKCRYAITDGCFEFEHPNAPKLIPNKAPVEKPNPPSKRRPQVTILKRETLVKKYINQSDLEVATDRGPPKLEVNILSCKSPSQIYVTLVSVQDALNNLFDNLQTYYDSTAAESRDSWESGNTCCVLSSLSKTWRRAVIMQVDGDKAKVFYTDFAVVEEVPLTELKVLESGFSTIRDGAIKCHMSGVLPGGSTEWPSITCEHLRELLDQYQRFFITKKGEIKEKSLPVELWVYHVIAGGALEPNTGEWRRLNDNLISQGLAIPDYSEGCNSDAVISGDEFLNKVQGSMEEWLKLETVEQEPLVVHLPEDVDVSSICSHKISPKLSIDVQWPKAEPPTNREFIGVPTYVSDDFHIYLHDVAQEDVLNLISKTLDTCFMDSDAKPGDMLWTVGQACIVKYVVDKHYYRGQVMEVLDDCKCKVMFVDYANVEDVPVIFMRKKLVMCQMPIQTLKCSLVGIEPIGGEWTTNSLTMVHQLIVEQKCFVRVIGDLDSEILEVELKLHKQNLNDLLVECGLACISDLSISCQSKNILLTKNIKDKEDTKTTTMLDFDSEPDYIIDNNDSDGSHLNTGTIDWVKMIDEDDQNSNITCDSEKFITYPPHAIPCDDSDNVRCTVAWIDDVSTMQLSIRGIDEETEAFHIIVDEMQKEGATQPIIEGLYEFKACIALFSQDRRWYRALVLQQDEERGFVKVRYVDYGNCEIIPIGDVREIKENWCSIPARVVNAELHDICSTQSADLKVLNQEYQKIFMNVELVATIIQEKRHVVVVEMRMSAHEQLLYQHLIDRGLLVRSSM